MPIDASIALGVRPPQIESPVNALARVLQIKGLQQDQELGAMKADEYKRGIGEKNRLQALLQGGADPSALRQGGFLKEANEWEEKTSKIGAEKATAAKNMADVAHKQIGLYRDASQAITDPQSAVAFVQNMHGDPLLKDSLGRIPLDQVLAQIPQDPAQLPAWKQQFALGATKFMELNKPTITTRNLGGTTDTLATDGLTGKTSTLNSVANSQSPDNAASNARMAADAAAGRAVQIRGQDLVNDRARDAASAGKVPAGYRQKADGSLEFIPGGPADPAAAKKAAPTEFQGKNALFGARAQEANRLISELDGKYSPTAVNAKQALGNVWGVGGALEAGANAAMPEGGQKAEQAQRDFINAILRLESGAAIGKDEFDNAKKQYFPQSGDTKAVVAQKKANRELAVQGLLGNAGNAVIPKAPGATKAESDADKQLNDLLKKYGG